MFSYNKNISGFYTGKSICSKKIRSNDKIRLNSFIIHKNKKISICHECASTKVCKHPRYISTSVEHWVFLKKKYIFKFLLIRHLKNIIKNLKKDGQY